MPLLRSLAGAHFPLSHTRRYIQRFSEANHGNENIKGEEGEKEYPATVLVGSQEDFEYDAIAELVFRDEEHFRVFMEVMGRKEAAESIAKDEEAFLDRGRLWVVAVGVCVVTQGVMGGVEEEG